ncbi:MAG: phosphatase PAP2 family protein [Comamonadaceae bacterium]|nr:MAG: phosphatase PAP2 family protein [Comamonadaceae bacterium]
MDALVGATPRWHVALARRCATLWPLKLVGNTAATVGFFVLYFAVMQQRLPHAWLLPLTPLDRWLELRVAALPLYASLWLYLALPPAFAKDLRELAGFALGAALMSGIALAVFWFWPTAVPIFAIDGQTHQALHFLKTTDAAGNAFPSLHVSFSVFACGFLARQLREVGAPAWVRAINVAWAAGIVYSTLAVRQHVVIDVVGGLLLGAAFCVVPRFFKPNRPVAPVLLA